VTSAGPAQGAEKETDMAERYRLIGGEGSPYSVKMRAILRYRRLPFVWVQRRGEVLKETAHVRPPIIPILQFPEDDTFHVDSTPLAFELERRHPVVRSILPDDPGHAFLCHLLEDTADEWGTKVMFDYRWAREIDQEFCSRWLAAEMLGPASDAELEEVARQFRERQVDRMPLVGCTAENRPLIEETYRRVLSCLEKQLAELPFLFGTRPSLADFGWFGQLYQLSIDPTPMGIMRETAPRTCGWICRTNDASGVTGEWIDPKEPLPPAVRGLLELAGEIYLPFLAANAAAFERGDEQVSLKLLGRPYAQASFRYQVKCLRWLREKFATLPAEARERVAAVLRETGGLEVLSG
jgi:glutathione S-transferase